MSNDDFEQFFYPMPYDVEEGKVYKWCGCKKSKTQPLCDNSDCETYINFYATLTETVYFCGCKQSQDPPLCDGSHGSVMMEYIKTKREKNG